VSGVALLMTAAELEALIDRRVEAKLAVAMGRAEPVAPPTPDRDVLNGYVVKRPMTAEEIGDDAAWDNWA
jgi:hypothetical protein